MLLGQILGSIGLVLMLSTPLTFIIAGQAGALIWVKLGLGIAFMGYYFATNKKSAKRSLGGRAATMWTISGATIAVFLVALAAVNFISFKNPKEWDLTREGIHTLSDQTAKTLQGLKEEVTVHAFYRSDEPQHRAAKETFERLQQLTQKLKVEFVDPVAHPEEVEKFQIREGGSRIVLTARGMHEARPKDLSEQEITNALIKVTAGQAKKIYFLTGHGELDITDQTEKGASEAANAVRNEGYTVETFSLAGAAELIGAVDLNAAPATATEPKIPGDAQAIVILAPKVALTPGEVEALSKWAQKGGKLLIGLEARRDTGLEKLANAWHIDVRNDLVVDRNPVTQMLGLPPTMALVQAYDEHPITKDFRAPIAFPGTRSLDVKDSLPGAIAGVSAKALARTGKTSWGETDFTSNQASFDAAKDSAPPLILAAVATKKAEGEKVSEEGRVVVMGDGEFTGNRYFNFQANGDFFVNALNYLADEEGKISIRPKQRGASRIFLTETQSDVIKFFSIDILPVAILAVGVAVRGVRRRK